MLQIFGLWQRAKTAIRYEPKNGREAVAGLLQWLDVPAAIRLSAKPRPCLKFGGGDRDRHPGHRQDSKRPGGRRARTHYLARRRLSQASSQPISGRRSYKFWAASQ